MVPKHALRWTVIAGVALSTCSILARAQGLDVASPPPAGLKITTRDYDVAALARPHGLPDNIYRGRVIFMQRCAYCHDGVGQPSYNTKGPFLDPELITPLGDAGIRMFVVQGTDNMPGYQYALTPAQIDDVIAYVKTIPASAKPTEDQLAGRLPGAKGGGRAAEGGGD
ncbi:cytochrome c [Novosphingobium flavum]|uniref:Cytochrome c n=1 Tax=Novosphingobium flavum TaxID=1778672 RepID=A0A7X1KLE4_9SPHN|nr:cytochrome c [Novosphingobium flavum]MBC2665516.1 cytochrome c [Novosphingobium flavum]